MDQDKRLQLQIEQYGRALAALEDALADDDGDKKSRDSILLSFVFTFEMAWKCLRFTLIAKGMETPDFAAGALRAAFQARLIDDADSWTRVKDMRNEISHAYDQARAVAIAVFVRESAMPLFRALHGMLGPPA